MKQDAALIIDIGTGSTRVAVISSEGKIVGIKGFKNTYYVDSEYSDAKYFLPNELKQNIFSRIEDLLSELKDYKIKYLSSSSARESFVLLDKAGHDFYGLPNIDNRGKEWLSEITQREYIEKVTGRPLTEDFGAMKLYGLKQKKSSFFESITQIISLSDWVGYLFTGKIEMEYSQASETQLFNIYTKDWDQKVCEAFEINRSILPTITKTGTTHEILSEMKTNFALDSECLYVVGGADTQLAAKGMALSSDDIGLISGTSSPVVKYKEAIPNYEENKEFNFWSSCNLAGEGYQIETNPGVTGLNLQLAKDKLLPEGTYEAINQHINDHYEALKCLASFTSQSPYKNISFPNGGFMMTVPFNQELEKIDFLHAVVADIAFSIVFKIRQNEVLSQTTSPYIVGAGGGLRMESLCQMIADLTGKKLVLKENFDEASLIGAARICFSKEFQLSDIPIVMEFEPKESKYLREKLENWLLYREKINSKKEIGAF
ncbi:FGGY-family carbohydrate kinase [Enterococcus malodoratus]|uniref:FGGY-family carbohydrate kinase n=1 Tax=Enterococcus malodoratus TaxID=71451 RepID=UPI0039AFA733